MEKTKAILVDDENKVREVLKLKIEKYCKDVIIVGEATNIDEAYQLILKEKPEIVFLDIAMPGGSGFELLDRFDKIQFQTIFITGYNEYALDALKVSAVDYLLKPIHTESLVLAVNKALERIEAKYSLEQYELLKHNLNHLENQNSRIAVPGTSAYDLVVINDIIRCEGWNKYTKIFTKDDEVIVSSYNIGVFKEMLSNFQFYATHKSHLINTQHIKRYLKEGTVVMSDGSHVPVSRRSREEFLNEILK